MLHKKKEIFILKSEKQQKRWILSKYFIHLVTVPRAISVVKDFEGARMSKTPRRDKHIG